MDDPGKYLNSQLTLILYLYAVQCQIITIVEHPSSLLVPVNETAIFSCTAHIIPCSSPPCRLRGQWIVNSEFISRSHDEVGVNELTLYWRINHSNSRNTSEVRCHFSYVFTSADSNIAVLEWIDDPPLYHNPCIESDTSNLNVSWSPAFLWPGRALQYFNVSFTNKSDDRITYHRINSTFDARVVSFTRKIQEEPLMCTEIAITISAISAYSHGTLLQPLQLFNVMDRIFPSPSSFNLSEITASNIHPRCNESNLVDLELSIQLQLQKVICNDDKVNLTFIIRNESDNVVIRVDTIQRYNGSCVMAQNLSLVLEANQTYSLTFEVENYSSHIIATNTQQFDTLSSVDLTGCEENSTTTKSMILESESPDPDVKDRPDHDGLLDYLLMGGSLTLVLGTIITVVTCYYLCYYRKKKRECRFEELRARIQTSLMNNPIYSPMPVYEQISPRYIPQTTTIITDGTERSTQPDLSECTPTCSNHQASDLSNDSVMQPIDVQNGLQLIDSTNTLKQSDPMIQNISDDIQAADTTEIFEHKDLIGDTQNDDNTADASPMTPRVLDPNLTMDTINSNDSVNDGKVLRTQAVVDGGASMTKIKQEAEILLQYTNDTD